MGRPGRRLSPGRGVHPSVAGELRLLDPGLRRDDIRRSGLRAWRAPVAADLADGPSLTGALPLKPGRKGAFGWGGALLGKLET